VLSRSKATGMTHSTPHTRKGKEERTQADQIALECRVTDRLQKEVERSNPQLKNFQLRLEMEW
jgi:hypothetical protein